MKREEAPMYAFTQDVPITDTVYAGIVEKLSAGPMPGLVAHMCVRREDGGLRYIDVWESQAACDAAFEEYVHPAVYSTFKQLGFVPAGEPARLPLEIVDIRLGDRAATAQ